MAKDLADLLAQVAALAAELPPGPVAAAVPKATATGTEMLIEGVIGWDVTVAGVRAALARISDDAAVTLRVNSPGGYVTEGFGIFNLLAQRKGAVTARVDGVAASAASYILMAASRIEMPQAALIMIHNARMLTQGTKEDHTASAEQLSKMDAIMTRIYAARTGQDPAAIAAAMEAETWMDGPEAVALGYADALLEPAATACALPPLSPDARALLAGYRHAPAAIAAALAEVPSNLTTTPPKAETSKETIMAVVTPPEAVTAPVPPVVPPVVAPPAQASVAPPAPVASAAELGSIAQKAGLDLAWVMQQAEARATVEAARAAALDALAERSVPPRSTIIITTDEGDTLRNRLSGAFQARLTGATPTAEQRDFAGIGFHGLIREIMIARGEKHVHRLTGMELAERALAYGSHTTSDFAGILANTLNKTVRALYGAYPNTWSNWCDEVEVADYKPITAATIGQASEVQPVQDGGQIVYGTIAEDAPESYQVVENGLILPVGKQALVNDDARALAGAAQNMALAAYTRLRRVAFGQLTANANMADGIALFAAGHNNLDTAAALSAVTYGNLRNLLNAQTGPARAGRPIPPLPPVTNVALLTGTTRERIALELLGPTIVPNAVSNALPMSYRSTTELTIDPFLNTGNNPFYLARTNPGLRPVEIAYIQGRRMPEISQAEKIDYTGVMFRVIFDFQAKSVTWRTIAGNLGV